MNLYAFSAYLFISFQLVTAAIEKQFTEFREVILFVYMH